MYSNSFKQSLNAPLGVHRATNKERCFGKVIEQYANTEQLQESSSHLKDQAFFLQSRLQWQQLDFIVNFIDQYSNRINESWIRFLNENFCAAQLDQRIYWKWKLEIENQCIWLENIIRLQFVDLILQQGFTDLSYQLIIWMPLRNLHS